MRRPSFRFETVARASVIFLVMIFVAAAMLMASKNPSQAATVAKTGNPSASASDAAGADARLTSTSPVTIIGCLEQKDDAYRLKDTEGDDVPKARSWKSGFLRKAPSAIAIVDPSNRMKLSTHIGERISVTGVLIDREMKVRSLHKVAASCG
jgi:hypothetical protein